MPTATYTCQFTTESFFNSHPTATLSGPSSTIPSGATVTNISFSVYCGVTTYNYNADTCMTITDSSGSSVSIESTCNTGSTNRIWAEFGGTPSKSLSWNNLSSIMLYGTNKLATRTGYTATLTLTYTTPSSGGSTTSDCTPPTSIWADPDRVGPGMTTTLYWAGASAGVGNPIYEYTVYRGTSLSSMTSIGSTSGTSMTVTAASSVGTVYYYRVAVLGKWSEDEVRSNAYGTLTTISYGACSAPTLVSVSADSAAPGEKVTLSWSGADSGDNNPITGYQIYRSTSPDSGYTLLTAVGSTAYSGSATVAAPTTNGTIYYYKVLTVGTASGYDSAQSTAYAALTCSYASVGAPTTLTLSLTNAAPGAEATLTWSGATAGANNAIIGYEVYRSTASDGDYTLLATVESADTSGSTAVTAPTENGTTYYYRVKTIGALDDGDSALSTAYTALACTYSAPNAPTKVTVNGAASAYVLTGAAVLLAWSGASAGANNALTGYEVYRDGVLYTSLEDTATTSLDVPAHDTAGNAYAYTIVACGTYSNSAASTVATVYTYTDPSAPGTVTVSADTVSAGYRVTMSWSGATAGAYNEIVGYRILRAESVNGIPTMVAGIESMDTAATCYVDAPSRAGATYYYRVETVGAHSSSDMSTAYASVTAAETSGDGSGDVTVIVPVKPPRKRRGLIIGDYDTATEGPWTLTGWSFAEPEAQTSYLDIPGRSAGPLDMTTALTGGDPRYGSRVLTATFECSEGTRLARRAVIEDMVNRLHGHRLDIVLPDEQDRYITGRVAVQLKYNDIAHAAVTVTAVCEPWRYSRTETWVELMVAGVAREVVLSNAGRRLLVPELTVTGYNARVTLECDGLTWELTKGVHRLPDLILRHGNTMLTYSGTGTVTIKYREAWL